MEITGLPDTIEEMRVITVDNEKFGTLCTRLLYEVRSSGYEFDTVVAIARGGVKVAERIFGSRFYTVTGQRSGTPLKRLLKPIISLLPRKVTSFLRIAEARLLGACNHFGSHKVAKTIEIDVRLRSVLSEKNHRILIVDDAADSGETLLKVVESLRAFGEGNEIRTAVITSTRKNQLISPDYTIYRDGTLIRFPWAPDA